VAEFFVRRPIVAMVIAIITVIVGTVALQTLPIAEYPAITPPMVEVSGTYTGASAVNVEQSVATPIEQKINGVEDMIYMNSTNSSDGRFSLEVSFGVGTDLDMANVLTQNRVSEAQAVLPEEVKRLGVTVKKKLSFPLLLISVVSPRDTYDDQFLTNYATLNLIDELARIRGVGLAEVVGGSVSEYAMRVWVRPDQLAKLNLTAADIKRAIQQQNVLVPAGQIGGAPAKPGTEFTYTVTTGGRFETAEEFGSVVVRAAADGSQVLLRDIARIELGTQNYLVSARTGGNPTALLQIFQLPDANGLEVAAEVLEAMERLSESFPEDVEYVVSLDTTKSITAGIREIVITLFEAVALVILVVYIFLQNFRSTLIPTIAVPVSLIGAFAVFPLLGFSINTLSLLGLVLAIGIVVDDAIVVVESVTSKMEGGLGPKEATVEAMREVSGPIVATSLVLDQRAHPESGPGGPAAEASGRDADYLRALLRCLQPGFRSRDRALHGADRVLHQPAGSRRRGAVGDPGRYCAALPRRPGWLHARGGQGLRAGGSHAARRGLPAAHRGGNEAGRDHSVRHRCRREHLDRGGLQLAHRNDPAQLRLCLHSAEALG